MIPNSLKKFFAVGSGVGIEIAGPRGSETLRVSAVRVRPNGAKTLGGFSIENAAQQLAAEWGQAYAAFLKKLGLKHVVAAVLLPREDVILRQISVPGVSDKDLPAAVGFQMDGLHPYDENDVVSSWARLPGTSMVMVAIARRAALERYTAWFSEAGVKVGSFTCAPAAIYSARRLFAPEPLPAVLAMEEVNGRMELYGESPSRPLFSASFDATPERATTLACAELRLDPLTETRSFHALVGASPALPYAAALAAACPRLFLPINLLPTELRSSNSRALWIPTAVAAGLVLIAAVALAAYPSIEDRRYLKTLNDNIAQVKPQAMLAAKLDKDIETARQRTILLDQLRKRSKLDIDVIGEMTRILPPPIWLNSLEISRTQVTVAGESDQAAPLLKQIDASPFFEASEFSMPPVRTQAGEVFRIRSNREAGK
jgi:Tfp pilus assembly protein PilN